MQQQPIQHLAVNFARRSNMKISVDDQELFTLSETQKKVIMNDIHEEIFEEDMKRRLHYILTHKYERCFERLKKEWDQKLAISGVKMIPTDPDEYADLVFSQSSYKNRKQREEEIVVNK
jgi:hypothetical protein